MVFKNNKPTEQPAPKIDAIWLKEAQRRLDDLLTGKVRGIPADEVFAKARKQLR